jgi:hypothetical protein
MTQWILLRPDEECPVWEVMPAAQATAGARIQEGHSAGLYCKCKPCFVDGEINSVLVHHILVRGKPKRCTEPNAHDCHLKENQ